MPPRGSKSALSKGHNTTSPIHETTDNPNTALEAPGYRLEPGDQRMNIEKDMRKFTDADFVFPEVMHNMTAEQLEEAVLMYQAKKKQANPDLVHVPEHSGETRRSRGSVFERLEKPREDNEKAQSKDVRDTLKAAEIRSRIRKEEEAKLEATVQRRIREEEDKIFRNKRSRDSSPESELERTSKQEQLLRAVRELRQKVEGDVEIGEAATPFSRKLEAIVGAIRSWHYDL